MIAFFFDYFFPLVVFCYIVSKMLFRDKCIDNLRWLFWRAFLATLPWAAFLSLVILAEPIGSFVMRVFFFACLLLIFQLSRSLNIYLPKLLRRPLNYLCVAIDDFFAFITYIILFRSKCWHSISHGGLGKGKTPVLMIHGYKHDAGAWLWHQPRLVEEGCGPIFVIDLGSATHAIEEYAHRVQVKAEKIALETGTQDLILIGFSMGGVVASYYALHLAAEDSVKGVVTMASPLEGTRMALLGGGPCAAQMRFKAPFITELKAKIVSNQRIPFCHIGSSADPVIRPPTSAWQIGGYSDKIVFEDMGHLSMLYSNAISTALYSCLKKWN